MGSYTITPGLVTPDIRLLPKQRRRLFQESPVTCFKTFPGLLFPLILIPRFRCQKLGVTSAGQPIKRSRELRSTSQQETSLQDDLRRRSQEVDSPDASTKTCVQCGYSKPLEDFEILRLPLGERSAACRACLAVLRARRSGGPLFHLGLSVEEAWEQAKTCTKCGVRKELRDFIRDGKRISAMCRPCKAKYVKQAWPPVDVPQKCSNCEKVKPVSHFHRNAVRQNGLQELCKACYREREKARYARHRSSPLTLKLTEKMCGVCKQTKSSEEFYSSPMSLHGLRGSCKTCYKLETQRRDSFSKRQ